MMIIQNWASQVVLVVKNLLPNAEDIGLDPSIEKIPWRRAWQPIPVFLPGESHGQRSFRGEVGRATVRGVAKELDTT